LFEIVRKADPVIVRKAEFSSIQQWGIQ